MWTLIAFLGFVLLTVGVVALIQPPVLRITTRVGGATVAIAGLIVLQGVNGPLTAGAVGKALSADCQDAVDRELVARKLTNPTDLEVRGDGFIVATYVIPDEAARFIRSKEVFGEERLIAIREALLPCGFTNYRVNVHGTPPGTGLISRYGSSRYIDGGKVEWLTP